MAKKNSKLYRLTLNDDTSHKRIWLWRFSKAGIIVGAISAAVLLFGIFYSLIAFTPLRVSIPGYPDAHFKQGAIENALKVDSLENEMLRWTLYAENLARVLAGEESLSGTDSLIAANTTKFLEDLSREEISRRDSILRTTVAREEQFGVGSDKSRTLPIEGMHFFTPLKGVISRPYDRVLHPAIDITAPAKSVVSAVLDGTVIFSGWTDDAGYSIILQHEGNVISCYKHNQTLLRKEGEKVTAGTPISLIGNTGTDQLHKEDYLHFELWYEGEAVDPTKYCKF